MSKLNLNSTLAGLRTDFDKYYEFGSVIGKGKYAVVKKCYCKETQRCYAAKVIRKFRAIDNHLKMNIVENEINALKLVQSHPSIINLYDVFHRNDEIILLLEYATQRDLQPYLGLFEEEIACYIIYQVLKAIEYLHSKNILHLDIKPENVLLMIPISSKIKKTKTKLSTPNSDEDDEEDDEDEDEEEGVDNDGVEVESISETNSDENNNNDNDLDELTVNKLTFDKIKVKLCDFSFSQVITGNSKILGMMGTVAYSAPEVLEYEQLTKATDMWSLGVLIHVLLSSYTPFGNGNTRDCSTQTNILNTRGERFECDESCFENLSKECIKLIEELLVYRPKQRLTVEQALNHEWFKKWDIKAKIVELEQSIISATSKITATSEETVAKVDITTSNNNENKNESAQQVETNSILTTTTTTYFHYHSKLPNPNLTLHIYNHVVVDDTNDNNNKSLKISNNNNNELSTNSIATAAL